MIDGSDGSGKATQTKLLVARLKKAGVPVKTIDFPRYYKNFFGGLLGQFLAGEFGDFAAVDPHVASIIYAADRFESSAQIRAWLDAGFVVVADRYVSANQMHQGGKIADTVKRKKFLDWLEKMEYGVFKIPRPDLTVFLDVPIEVSREWMEQKLASRKKKGYLKGRKDVVEANLMYLKNSHAAAIGLANGRKDWVRVECCKGMVCMLPDAVSDRVFEIVKKKLRLK